MSISPKDSLNNLNLSSTSFKGNDWQTGYMYFDSSSSDHQHKVYEQMWIDRGKPQGDLEYGQHAFRCQCDQWSTNEEKAEAIDRFVESVIQQIHDDELRMSVSGGMSRADSLFRVVNRIASRLHQSPQGIERGIHMAEFVGTVVPRVMKHFSVMVDKVPRFFNSIGNMFSRMKELPHLSERSQMVVHRTYDVFNHSERFKNIIKRHRSDEEQRMHDQAGDNLENLGGAAWDLLQAAGAGASGDLGGAQQKLIDASIRMTEVFFNKPSGSSGNN